MKKYSKELKQKVIREYKETSISLSKLARKYEIKSPKSIRERIRKYEIYGLSGIENPKNLNYPSDLKQNVIKCALTEDLNFRELADKFEIRNPKTVSEWVRKFQEEKNFPKINLTIDFKEEYLEMKKNNKKKDYREISIKRHTKSYKNKQFNLHVPAKKRKRRKSGRRNNRKNTRNKKKP